jgi:hypothetical protein
VFCWPLDLTALSVGRHGVPGEARLEVSARGALLTLTALSHVGHPAHLGLVDAYLKGQVRVGSDGIGQDCRTVVASLAAPLVAAYELGVEHLTLSDLILLPPDAESMETPDRTATGASVRSAESPRFLLRADGNWLWLRAAERFEMAGCLGTRQVGTGEPWHDVVVELPVRPGSEVRGGVDQWRGAVTAEVRASSRQSPAQSDAQIVGLRVQALVRSAGSPIDAPAAPVTRPADLALFLPDVISVRRPHRMSFPWHGMTVAAVLTPEPDGSQTLCLLPPPDVVTSDLKATMRQATWDMIEALIGRPLAERRTEPFVLRVIGPDRATTLDVGESVVIVRNQTVFAAWVGSDGRVMIKLHPPQRAGVC